MKASCDITIEFESQEIVKTILQSVNVDDFNFIDSKIDGKKLKSTIKASSISSLLHTLDDYLSCISVAMNILDKD